MELFDTIIIGAGWAGAVAARQLASAGRSVLVLEARDRVGGRAHTWTPTSTANGAHIDLGCAWIHGFNEGNPARAIAAELGVTANVPKPAPGLIYGADGALTPADAGALRSALGEAVSACRTPHPTPAPTESLADGLFSAGSLPLATGAGRAFARTLEVGLGVPLERASLRWAGWEGATAFAGSDAAPEGGYQALVGKVIADAEGKGAKIRLGEEVVSVKDKVGEVEAVSVKTDRGVYTARTVLSTIPLGVLQAAPADLFQPALPDCLVSTITRTVVGTLEKVVLSYEVVWWPNPEAASYTLLPVSDTPPTQDSPVDAVLAASTLTVANFAAPTLPGATSTLVTYLSHTPATALAGRPASEIAAGLHAYIATRLGVSAPPKATDIAVTAWRADPLARGATSTPSAISTDGSRSPMDFKELGRPLWEGRLGFAGEHTDMEHRGSVAGAVVSGQREAARIERWLAKHEQ